MGIYTNLEDKWYDFVDYLDQFVPVGQAVDKVDRVVPSFLLISGVVFLILILLLSAIFINIQNFGFDTISQKKILVYSEDNLPLAGVELQIDSDCSTGQIKIVTNLEGVAIANICSDEINLKATKIGYQDYRDQIITSEETIPIKLLAINEGGPADLAAERTVHIEVLDNLQNIINEAKVEITCGENTSTLQDQPSQGWDAKISCNTTAQLKANAIGYQQKTVILINTEERKIITLLEIDNTTTVYFEVTDPNGGTKADIVLKNEFNETTPYTTNTLGTGNLKIKEGTYRYTATSTSTGEIKEGTFQINAGEQKVLQIEFETHSDLVNPSTQKFFAIELVNDQNQPIPNAKIEIYKNDGNTLPTRATAANGKTTPVPILDVNQQLIGLVDATGYEKKIFNIELQDKDAYQRIQANLGGAKLKITVTDDINRPENKALVQAKYQNFLNFSILSSGYTDNQGNLILENLPAGNYQIYSIDHAKKDETTQSITLTKDQDAQIKLILTTGTGKLLYRFYNPNGAQVVTSIIAYEKNTTLNSVFSGLTNLGRYLTSETKKGTEIIIKTNDNNIIPYETIPFTIDRTQKEKEIYLRKSTELPNQNPVQIVLEQIYTANPLNSNMTRTTYAQSIQKEKDYWFYFTIILNNENEGPLIANFYSDDQNFVINNIYSIDGTRLLMTSNNQGTIIEQEANNNLVSNNAIQANVKIPNIKGKKAIPVILQIKTDANATNLNLNYQATHYNLENNTQEISFEYETNYGIGKEFCFRNCPAFLFSNYLEWTKENGNKTSTPITELQTKLLLGDQYKFLTKIENLSDIDFSNVELVHSLENRALNAITLNNDKNQIREEFNLEPYATSNEKNVNLILKDKYGTINLTQTIEKLEGQENTLKDLDGTKKITKFTIGNKNQLVIEVSPKTLNAKQNYPQIIIKTRYNTSTKGISANWYISSTNGIIANGVTDQNGLAITPLDLRSYSKGDTLEFKTNDDEGSLDGILNITLDEDVETITETDNCLEVVLNIPTPITQTPTQPNNLVADFPGTIGSYILVPNSSTLSNFSSGITLEAKIYQTGKYSPNGENPTAPTVIMSKGKMGEYWEYRFMVEHDGKLAIATGASGIAVSCNPVISLNQWKHVAVTIDKSSNTTKMFVDGQEVSICENSTDYGFNSRGNDIMIGQSYPMSWVAAGGWTGYYDQFKGKMDNVKIWNKALSAQEINNSKNNDLNNISSNPVLLMNFENRAKDSSTNNNNGIMQGSTGLLEETSPGNFQTYKITAENITYSDAYTLNKNETATFLIKSTCDTQRRIFINTEIQRSQPTFTIQPNTTQTITLTATPRGELLGAYPVQIITINGSKYTQLKHIDVVISDPDNCFELHDAVFDLTINPQGSSIITNNCFSGRKNNFYPEMDIDTTSVTLDYEKPGIPEIYNFTAKVQGSAIESNVYGFVKTDVMQAKQKSGKECSGSTCRQPIDIPTEPESATDDSEEGTLAMCEEVTYTGDHTPKPEPELEETTPPEYETYDPSEILPEEGDTSTIQQTDSNTTLSNQSKIKENSINLEEENTFTVGTSVEMLGGGGTPTGEMGDSPRTFADQDFIIEYHWSFVDDVYGSIAGGMPRPPGWADADWAGLIEPFKSPLFTLLEVENENKKKAEVLHATYFGGGEYFVQYHLQGDKKEWYDNWFSNEHYTARLKGQVDNMRVTEFMVMRTKDWEKDFNIINPIEGKVYEFESYLPEATPEKIGSEEKTVHGHAIGDSWLSAYSLFTAICAIPNGFIDPERAATAKPAEGHEPFPVLSADDPFIEYDSEGKIRYKIPEELRNHPDLKFYLRDGKFHAEYVGRPTVNDADINFTITKNNLVGTEYAVLTIFDWVGNEVKKQSFQVRLTSSKQTCVSSQGDIGQTGPGAVPKILLNWNWGTITANQCDEKNPNSIYCDATQFTISLFKKIEEIENLLLTNRLSEIPSKTSFDAYLLKDNYNQYFLNDFAEYYSTTFANASPSFNQQYKYFILDNKLIFDSNIPFGGKYAIDIELVNLQTNTNTMFENQRPTQQIKVTITPKTRAPNYSPLYELPFNGEVGKDNRIGYGVVATNEINLDNSVILTTNGNGVMNLNTSTTPTNLQNGIVLSYSLDDVFNFTPSQPTPVTWKITKNNVGTKTATYKLTPTSSLTQNNWVLTSSTLGGSDCRDFEDSTSKYFTIKKQGDNYVTTWNSRKTGTIQLSTVFFNPEITNTSQLTSIQPTDPDTMIGKPTTQNNKNVLLNYYDSIQKNNYKTFQDVLNLVQTSEMCISTNPTEIKIYWNPEYLSNLIKETSSNKCKFTVSAPFVSTLDYGFERISLSKISPPSNTNTTPQVNNNTSSSSNQTSPQSYKKLSKFLWKPSSDSDRRLVVLYSGKSGVATIYGPNGNKIETGTHTPGAGTRNGYQDGTRFSKPGSAYPAGSYVVVGGTHGCKISRPGSRTTTCSS